MQSSLVAVATITRALPGEETTLLDSLRRLASLGMPVALADGGSGAAFVDALESIPGGIVAARDARGLVPQVQASVDAAWRTGARVVLYTEPDKEAFFAAGLEDFIARAACDEPAGVCIAERSEDAFATFPPMQRYVEGVINRLCGEAFDRHGDYSYGPFLIHRDLVNAIAGMRRDLGWGWRHALFSTAHRLGRGMEHIVGDYECPLEQREEDERDRIHRMRQLSENIAGLIHGMQPR